MAIPVEVLRGVDSVCRVGDCTVLPVVKNDLNFFTVFSIFGGVVFISFFILWMFYKIIKDENKYNINA